MSKYTIELSKILTQLYLNKKYTEQEQINYQYDFSIIYEQTDPVAIVNEVRTSFFNFNYPLYDENHKEELEKKILYHYWDYEIGVESYAKFKFNINKTLNEIMPYYNKIYKAVENDFEFNVNINYKEEIDGLTTSNAQNESSNKLESETTDTQNENYTDRLRESDTPQNNLTDVEQGKYISKYNYNNGNNALNKTNELTSESNIESSSTGRGTNKSTRTIKGTNTTGTQAEMLKEYISAIQNVDLMIIESLKSCFMLLF